MGLSEKWYSPRNENRGRKTTSFTLDPSTLAALERRAGRGRRRSQEAEKILRAGLGLPPVEVRIGRPSSKASSPSSSTRSKASSSTRSKASSSTRSKASSPSSSTRSKASPSKASSSRPKTVIQLLFSCEDKSLC
jgi:hypothetical protein